MKKNFICMSLFIILFIAIAPAFASTFDSAGSAAVQEFGAKEIAQQGERINSFIFNVLLRIAAGIAGSYGLIMAFFSGSIRPLITYGGIALICVIMPYFINGIFTASSMLIP